jgi:hypothetical protein
MIQQGSTSLRGNSFVELYKERLEYPIQILALDIKIEKNIVAEWRILSNGVKIFPFADVNIIPDGIVNIIPVNVAAGSLLTIEVRGTNPKASNVVILSEMDVIEQR